MKFSVIIPIYNSQATIARALDSVINQTYKDFEIILVDDGSSDNTNQVIKMFFKNKDIAHKYIYQENSGVSIARNRGIKETVGEYIAFLDSDDMWHPQKLEIVSNILSNDSINIIGHGYTLDNNFSNVYKTFDLTKVSFSRLLIKNFAVTPSIVVKKDVCERFNENMRYTEDHELWLRMAIANELYFCNLPLSVIGRKPLSKGGLSADRWAMRKGELQMYKNIVCYKKSLLPLYPFLVIFSLFKYVRNILKDFFAKN
ncbi:MAG: glycosyltransferase family 2 protein [Sulfurimonas sp.]|uniref:glycosyltransferase family 2 protein n=1 Tax=Sulfurimonas sp. TaxID=2022749 RepID=UPI00261F4FE3|nr:glycosyltransferase family 2 protein [Sulfurimonas sp.]MDD5371925.1 glycosyltransferase family 2 protein [Sulfurimonas sp.]